MKTLPKALPVLVLLFAAAEAVRARLEFGYRPTEWSLFAVAALLWLCFGLLALLPACLSLRWIEKRRIGGDAANNTAPSRATLVLAGWMIAPVLMHQVLDRHIGLGATLRS